MRSLKNLFRKKADLVEKTTSGKDIAFLVDKKTERILTEVYPDEKNLSAKISKFFMDANIDKQPTVIVNHDAVIDELTITVNSKMREFFNRKNIAGETDLHKLENYLKRFNSEAKKNSNDPWFEIISEKLEKDGKTVSVEVDYNDAFISLLRAKGYKGTEESELIEEFLYLMFSERYNNASTIVNNPKESSTERK